VDTIGALRSMGGIWASNNKSRASVTLIIKFRDSPERGGHFEESPTEILHHRGPAPHGGHLGQSRASFTLIIKFRCGLLSSQVFKLRAQDPSGLDLVTHKMHKMHIRGHKEEGIKKS